MKTEVAVTVGGFWLILWLFVFFWGQSGWYRIDCALHVQKACELIAIEYTKKDRP